MHTHFPGWVIGVGLSLMGSISTNIGMLLQKLDFILHAKRVEQEVKRALEDDETGDQASDGDVDVSSSH